MQNNQLKAINWIHSGMDYTKGVELLVELTRKQAFYNLFSGKDKSLADKLAYEICKAASLANHLTWKEFIREVQLSNKVESAHKLQPEQVISIIHSNTQNQTISRTEPDLHLPDPEMEDTKPLEQYPTIIRRIIHEYASLFQERSRLHLVMTELPDSNAETVCARRKELFDMVKSISARLEILYNARIDFEEKGIIPEESLVFPVATTEEAGPDLASLDEASLKKQKKNLQSSNSKDQTMLDYQATEKSGQKSPMANGPRRSKLEMRIEQRNKKIEEIDDLLFKYADTK